FWTGSAPGNVCHARRRLSQQLDRREGAAGTGGHPGYKVRCERGPRRLGPTARRTAVATLREVLRGPARHADRRMMTEHEVAALAAGGLIEIGAHSVNHPRRQ